MMNAFSEKSDGFALFEVLVGLIVIGIVIGGFYQVLAAGVTVHRETTRRQALVDQARWTLDRIAGYVRESDDIQTPAAIGVPASRIACSERTLDTDNNGIPDADNDADGRINEDRTGPDPREYVRFYLGGGMVYEQPVNYATAQLHDRKPDVMLCDQVSRFEAVKTADDLVDIYLTVESGPDTVALFTRVRARNVR